MLIRLARVEDLPSIVDIYNQSIPSHQSTADTEPVTLESRKNWFTEHSPGKYPVFIAEKDGKIAGWCSLSAYRPGRAALRHTAEISYYIAQNYHRQGVATALIEYALAACPQLKLKNLFAIVLERNTASLKLLEKLGFEKWGCLPRVADFNGEETGHLYYGRRVWDQ